MAKEERQWHPNFLEYMKMIANHPNYQGLRIDKKEDGSYKWIVTAKSEAGQARIKWCKDKAAQLGIPIRPGVYADVMLAIHPTKWTVCQICGRKMSLYYHYPNAHFLKSLNKTFGTNFTECDHISDIWDAICKNKYSTLAFSAFLIQKGELNLDPYKATKEEIINKLEFACRKKGKKCLGPGAMSDFPDRADGFHTYNRCCRATQDTGRSKENMKSYTKDRRAYEYWSDGNIHAANQFMGSAFFKGTTADHIGPISLGFVHDPRYLQPMPGGDNSSKRDRLQLIDIEKIIKTEARTNVYPMSWYSKRIWEYIKAHYAENQEKIAGPYRDALKQNMANFMYVLWAILTKCPQYGEAFLVESFLKPNVGYFDYSYQFNDRGDIIKTLPRHNTERNRNEKARYCRIAIDAVYDYNDKENRNTAPDLTTSEHDCLHQICWKINRAAAPYQDIKEEVQELMALIQDRLIKHL